MTMRSMPGRRAAVRRRAELEGIDHAREIGVDIVAAVAGDLERLVHDVRPVVADRARRQFDAVADDVVLEGEDIERILRLQRLETALRHREGVVAEVDLLPILVNSYIGKSTIQQNRTCPCRSGRAARRRGCAPRRPAWQPDRLAGGEENAVVGAEAERLDQLAGRFLAVILGDRPAASPFFCVM
jgi:hypothetical protein